MNYREKKRKFIVLTILALLLIVFIAASLVQEPTVINDSHCSQFGMSTDKYGSCWKCYEEYCQRINKNDLVKPHGLK